MALSSFSSFEIDVVKIDLSLVASIARDAAQAAIVKAILICAGRSTPWFVAE